MSYTVEWGFERVIVFSSEENIQLINKIKVESKASGISTCIMIEFSGKYIMFAVGEGLSFANYGYDGVNWRLEDKTKNFPDITFLYLGQESMEFYPYIVDYSIVETFVEKFIKTGEFIKLDGVVSAVEVVS